MKLDTKYIKEAIKILAEDTLRYPSPTLVKRIGEDILEIARSLRKSEKER